MPRSRKFKTYRMSAKCTITGWSSVAVNDKIHPVSVVVVLRYDNPVIWPSLPSFVKAQEYRITEVDAKEIPITTPVRQLGIWWLE